MGRNPSESVKLFRSRPHRDIPKVLELKHYLWFDFVTSEIEAADPVPNKEVFLRVQWGFVTKLKKS